ncbi:MAG: helix-turn-helix transcriptional regulator [Pseudomonadota bacterium]
MKDGPDIARVAALIGDPARANILSALMTGRALTVTELAAEAGVTASTTSIHLSKLEGGGLIRFTKQGRHRYATLTGPEVAGVLEALMGLAQSTGATRVRTGPRDPEMRKARICYDHLAGEMGVALYDSLRATGAITSSDDEITLTDQGRTQLAAFGIDIAALGNKRRRLCRPCLDWSMRRNHLAGSLGAALLARMQDLGWARRAPDSRVISFSKSGLKAFSEAFPT